MSIGPIIYIIVLVVGALIKRYDKQQKEAQRRLQNSPLTGPIPDSTMNPQPMQSGTTGQTAQTHPAPALSGRSMPPLVQRPQDLQEFTFDEEWLGQELERSKEHGIEQELSGVIKPSPEMGRKEGDYAETANAQAYWKSGRMKNRPQEVREVEPAPQKPSILPERLTPEALIQGIVLSEVLRRPRAQRPYRPIYLDRDK